MELPKALQASSPNLGIRYCALMRESRPVRMTIRIRIVKESLHRRTIAVRKGWCMGRMGGNGTVIETKSGNQRVTGGQSAFLLLPRRFTNADG